MIQKFKFLSRQLEAIVRIAESLSKMRLAAFATDADVDEALRLFQVSTLDAAMSGHLSGKSLSKRLHFLTSYGLSIFFPLLLINLYFYMNNIFNGQVYIHFSFHHLQNSLPFLNVVSFLSKSCDALKLLLFCLSLGIWI